MKIFENMSRGVAISILAAWFLVLLVAGAMRLVPRAEQMHAKGCELAQIDPKTYTKEEILECDRVTRKTEVAHSEVGNSRLLTGKDPLEQ